MSLFGDLFSTPSVPSGGLFGTPAPDPNRSQWWDALGLLGAALKDTSTRGQTNALGSYAQMMQANTQRAQRNAVAQRLGDVFTQPNQVAVTSAVNDMSAQAPRLRADAEQQNAQPFATPTSQDLAPVLAQGIGVGIDPAPYISLQKLETQKQPRILSPEEMKGYGFRDGAVGVMDENGFPRVLQSSDVKSPEAVSQEIYLKEHDPHLSIDRQNANTSAARLNFEQQQSDASDLTKDPLGLDYAATQYAITGKMPSLGYGKSAGANKTAIMSRAAKLSQQWGLSPIGSVGFQSSVKANQGALGKIAQMSSAVNSFENTMLSNIDIAKDMIAKGQGPGTFGSPLVNRWQRYIKGQYAGDPDVAKFNTAILTIQNEYAKIQSGSLGNQPVSDSARSEAHRMLNPDMTPKQILANFDYMTQEVGNRSGSLNAQQQALRDAIQGAGDFSGVAAAPHSATQLPAPATAGTAPAAHSADGIPTVQTPEEARRLPRGTKFRTPDGQLKVVP